MSLACAALNAVLALEEEIGQGNRVSKPMMKNSKVYVYCEGLCFVTRKGGEVSRRDSGSSSSMRDLLGKIPDARPEHFSAEIVSSRIDTYGPALSMLLRPSLESMPESCPYGLCSHLWYTECCLKRSCKL